MAFGLYSKFYETLDLKMIREALDCSPPNSPKGQRLGGDDFGPNVG